MDVEQDEAAKAVDLTVHVDQGSPVIIDKVETMGFDVLDPRRPGGRPAAGLGRRGPAPGAGRRAYHTQRHPGGPAGARVRLASVSVLEGEGATPGHVSLFVVAEPGAQSTFGRITVRGNERVSDGRVKSLLTMKEGQQFRISRVVDSQRRLYDREIFQFVSITPDTTGPAGGPVPVDVVLTPAKPYRLSITPGYGSEEKARITTTLRHLNFLGGARTALGTFRWSSLDRGVRASIEEPSVFRRGVSMSVGGQFWYANDPPTSMTTKGGRVTFAKTLERSDSVRRKQSLTTLSLTFVDEYEDYTVTEEALHDPAFYDDLIALGMNPLTGRAKGQLLALALDLQRNTTPT